MGLIRIVFANGVNSSSLNETRKRERKNGKVKEEKERNYGGCRNERSASLIG